MYATVPRIKKKFEEQLSIIIQQLGKPEKYQKSELETISPEDIRDKCDEVYFEMMIAADEHIPVLLQHPNTDETFIRDTTGKAINTEVWRRSETIYQF